MDDKLKVINSLEVVDLSTSAGECEYVLVEDNEQNRRALLECGFSKEQLLESKMDEVLDVAYLAFSYGGSDWFTPTNGFVVDGKSA
ncbi:hypothetical protein [Alicyclobacillus sp. SO9]|uniref:hypothetical protein n=1 Tax=Alicyclobacillus sp. SO9 TaxID=2665646 RepID=UPI0018E7DD31|nr:hypothetical protein [Alicyclobacillus sp. SO9]QQE79512.1 hypothetical protein GI364_03175 [Alicyclobacillus sp. SO9]